MAIIDYLIEYAISTSIQEKIAHLVLIAIATDVASYIIMRITKREERYCFLTIDEAAAAMMLLIVMWLCLLIIKFY